MTTEEPASLPLCTRCNKNPQSKYRDHCAPCDATILEDNVRAMIIERIADHREIMIEAEPADPHMPYIINDDMLREMKLSKFALSNTLPHLIRTVLREQGYTNVRRHFRGNIKTVWIKH